MWRPRWSVPIRAFAYEGRSRIRTHELRRARCLYRWSHGRYCVNTRDNRPSSSTKVSPFFLTHGYHLEPIEIKQIITQSEDSDNPIARGERLVAKLKETRYFAQAAIAVAEQQQECFANENRSPAHRFRSGDKVWLHLGNMKTIRP